MTKTCSPACLNGGICNSVTGLCICPAGWTGADCSIEKVTPVLKKCPDNCSGRGSCDYSTGVCNCTSGWAGADCSIEKVTPVLKKCPDNCSGHGSCDYSTGVCNCASGWTGADCGTSAHPDGKPLNYGALPCTSNAECVYYSTKAPDCVKPNFGAYCKYNGVCRFEPVENFPGYSSAACNPTDVPPYQDHSTPHSMAPHHASSAASKGSPAYVLLHSGHKGYDQQHHHARKRSAHRHQPFHDYIGGPVIGL